MLVLKFAAFHLSEGLILSTNMYCTQPSILSHLLSLLSLKQWQASDLDEEEEENTSVYIDTSGSRGRGWVTHLLHRLVEEGAKVENVSTIYSLSFRL